MTMWDLGDWRWGVAGTMCLLLLVGVWLPEILRRIRQQDPPGIKALRAAVKDEFSKRDNKEYSIRGIKDAVAALPKLPLGDGHSYSRLPKGTNVVYTSDGAVKLALPLRASATLIAVKHDHL